MKRLGALLVAVAAAWPAVAAPPREFDDRVAVTTVEVPVQVLVDGQPVRGLSAGDFEIWEGRRRRPVAGFEAVDLHEPGGGPTGRAAPPGEAALSAAARRHVLFLFDLSNVEPGPFFRAQQAALEVARSGLHPSDLAAVALFSATGGARLVLSFTPDRRQLELALRTLGSPRLVDRHADPLQIVLAEARVMEYESGSGISKFDGDWIDHVRDLAHGEGVASGARRRHDMSSAARSLEDLAAILGRVPANKHVVLLSEGFDASLVVPEAVGQDQRDDLEGGALWRIDSEAHFGSSRVQAELERMIESFRRSGVTVHAIDVGGLRAGGDAAEVRFGSGPTMGAVADRGRSGGDTLVAIARGTGGEMIENVNDLSRALGRVMERTAVTYLLSFVVDGEEGDRRWRPLEVRVPGLAKAELRHRRGYRLPSAEEGAVARKISLASALQGADGEGALAVGVAASALRIPGGDPLVPLVVRFDARPLHQALATGLLFADVFVYAQDADGRVADHLAQRVGIDARQHAAALRGGEVAVFGALRLPPADYTLRVLVLGVADGLHGLAVSALRVPDMAAAAALAPPIAVVGGDAALLARGEGDAVGAPYPFVFAGERWLPQARPRAPVGEPLRAWAVAYPAAGDEAAVTAWVETAQGERLGLPVALRRAAGEGYVALLAEVAGGGLAAGEYRLVVAQRGAPPGALSFRVGE